MSATMSVAVPFARVIGMGKGREPAAEKNTDILCIFIGAPDVHIWIDKDFWLSY